VHDGGVGADGPGSAIEDGDGVEVEIANSRPMRGLIGAYILTACADGQERIGIEERDGRAESSGRFRGEIPCDALIGRVCH